MNYLFIQNEEDAKITFPIKSWFMTKNHWEYYVIDTKKMDKMLKVAHEPLRKDIEYAYVLGFENEFGYIDMKELNPYRTVQAKSLKELKQIQPPPGFKWLKKENRNEPV